MPVTINGSNGVTFPDSTLQGTAAPGGGTTTTSAVDITLTNTSKQAQDITMTAADKFVTLPSATTLTPGANLFQLYNDNGYPFGIKDGAGNIIAATVDSNKSVSLSLLSNSTSAGIWVANANEAFGGVGPLATSTLSAGAGASQFGAIIQVTGLSSTAAFIAYSSGTTTRAVIATISGTTISYGTSILLDSTFNDPSSPAGYNINFTALSSTLVVGTSQDRIIAYSISGTTITQGATQAITGAALNGLQLYSLTSTTGVAVYAAQGASNGIRARAFSVSGTTITLGTEVIVETAAQYSGVASAKVASDKIVCIYLDNGAAQYYARAFTVSGTTITQGTRISLQNIFGYATSIYLLLSGFSPQTDVATFVINQGNFLSLSTSGTTLSILASGQISYPCQMVRSLSKSQQTFFTNQNIITDFNTQSATKYVVVSVAGTGSQTLCKLTSNGYAVSITPMTSIVPYSAIFGVATLDSTSLIAVSWQATLTAQTWPMVASFVVKVK